MTGLCGVALVLALIEPVGLVMDRLASPRVPDEYGEGLVLLGAERLRHDGFRGAYPADWTEAPLQVSPYPPAMYAAWAGIAELLGRGADFLGGRVVSTTAWLGLLAVGVALAQRLGASAGLAAATLGAMLVVYPVPIWLGVARVDPPGIAFGWLGLWFATGRPGGARVVAAALCFATALAFKQSLVAAPLAAGFGWLLSGRYAAAVGAGMGVASLGLGGAFLLDGWTDGGFSMHVVGSLRQDVDWRGGAVFTATHLLRFPLPGLAVLAGLPLLLFGWGDPRRRAIGLFVLISTAICAATSGKVGANTNYLLEPLGAWFLAATLGPVILAERMGWGRESRGQLFVTAAATGILLFSALWLKPELAERRAKRVRASIPFEQPWVLPPGPGFVMMNPMYLPASTLDVDRLYWNDPYTVSLLAATGVIDPETVTRDLRDGTVTTIVTKRRLQREPLGAPQYPGHVLGGWTHWWIDDWRKAAQEDFEEVPGGRNYHIYRRRTP